jgi:hypothetical protein
VSDCCKVGPPVAASTPGCPGCGGKGREVEALTLRALLRPRPFARIKDVDHRFCPTPTCPVVYFGPRDRFDRGDLAVPVFQKEPPGDRLVCYCFRITEEDLRCEFDELGHSTAADRITTEVKAGHCACEIENPQGTCCLGNVASVVRGLVDA